ncbi:hypothetical protein AB0M43_34790 [Longispora sp. NPDC051575]|uniref:hypothetical protein n=1 Tax=Longispora sp. NPDC051575 TaxID=3154943 RepID=UPI003441DC85
MLALAADDQVVAGTTRATGHWWSTPASADPGTRLRFAWSLARVPGVLAALAHTTPPGRDQLHHAGRLGAIRVRSMALPCAPILTTGPPPTPPAGMIRVPHLAGSQVLWEIVAEQSAARLLGHSVPDLDARRQVERAADQILILASALAAGTLPVAITDLVLIGWAAERMVLDIGLVYRHWSRVQAVLPLVRHAPGQMRRRGPDTGERAGLRLVCSG